MSLHGANVALHTTWRRGDGDGKAPDSEEVTESKGMKSADRKKNSVVRSTVSCERSGTKQLMSACVCVTVTAPPSGEPLPVDDDGVGRRLVAVPAALLVTTPTAGHRNRVSNTR